MRLDQLKIGRRCRVTTINFNHAVSQRLANFGLLPGQEIQMSQVAPLGDPIAITFAGQKISLRRREAALVEVEPVGA
ncbi:FeoA family protein [Cerasicoccus fimbriatus]|uniref:FeoA family protein n=1 Tax=Cerasicoccus fimbriatus TaxID=3014554 RepID=UPI0022B51736|nr:FeoA family protein [Cerasicoccus sp. TK19100]